MFSSLVSRKKRVAVIAVTATLIVGGGGAAFAFWMSSGSGSGSAQTGTSQNFTVSSTAPTGGPLTPGGPSQSVGFTIANPGTGGQTLTGVTVAVANADGSPWTSAVGCSAADYTVSVDSGLALGDIRAGQRVAGTVTVTMLDSATNQDACKGVTVPLYLSAS